MPVSVRCDLMTSGQDGSNEFWISPRDPTQNEKCGFDTMFCEKVKYRLGRFNNTRGVFVPTGLLNRILKCMDVKIIFDINGQSMSYPLGLGLTEIQYSE